uniref:Reverse transcriptase-rnase h-integrase n=1 Tax=Moniliophthora roreri TaxID=221103 RepID=A0A0W0FHI8_MONRR
MSNAAASSSSSSTSSSQPSGGLSPVPTVSGEGHYGENITYQHGLHLNPYQLLHIFNSRQYDDQLRAAVSSTDSDDKLMATDTLTPTSMIPEASSPDSPPNPGLSQTNSRPELLLLPVRPPNPSLPPPTPQVFRHLKPQFHHEVDVIPAVGGADPSEEDKDEDRENQTPSNDEDLPTLSLRSPTLLPTPMTQLVDRISALCADWYAILPGIAHSTCVADASQLSLDIHLHTALTNKGLAELHIKGLVQVQTLCQMIAVMTMNLTRISEENAERSIYDSGGDADFLFVGTDLWKVQRFDVGSSVYERMAVGWQPTGDGLTIPVPLSTNETQDVTREVPSTPMLRSIDEMPDTLYNYDTELYRDGEL